MSRAHGKHTHREPVLTPEQKREFGIDDRDIPGGQPHITQQPVTRQQVPAAEPLEPHRGMMAHGVPPAEYGLHDRTRPARPYEPHYAELREPPSPVPVYIVAEGAGPRPLKVSIPRHITVPGFNADPVCICGQDVKRTRIRLMNNDTTNNIRIAHDLTALVIDPGSGNSRTIGGALLPHGMTGYQDFETQDELWAIALTASTPVELQIIMETSVPGAG